MFLIDGFMEIISLIRKNIGKSKTTLQSIQHGPDDYIIWYVDKKGEKSKRLITIKKIKYIYDESDLLILAYCHQKHDKRTFIASRIVLLTEAKTDIPHDNGLAFLRKKYEFDILDEEDDFDNE